MKLAAIKPKQTVTEATDSESTVKEDIKETTTADDSVSPDANQTAEENDSSQNATPLEENFTVI